MGRVMATITSEQLSSRVGSAKRDSRLVAEFKTFWRQFFVRAFDPYRPELHYMRGPGPAWRAKHGAVSPAVQSMVTEIRAAKAARSPPGS
ncbi:MAG: hypothetical protein NVS4B4_05380 [Bradyrhizobium sp.]